jgi:hypothetical protein
MLNGPPINKWKMHKKFDLKSPQKVQVVNLVESLTKNQSKGNLCSTSAKLAMR